MLCIIDSCAQKASAQKDGGNIIFIAISGGVNVWKKRYGSYYIAKKRGENRLNNARYQNIAQAGRSARAGAWKVDPLRMLNYRICIPAKQASQHDRKHTASDWRIDVSE
ncbi:hypothetical protein ESA_01204 [Cronobacter sakazakii ATCC BAA-894]|uniref:Uncharacterized protein n=1 Tax=Cronobacter sakazakii (strain ATCC BAA-894) TaxID=290339 RepID=A7MJN5_CROS8|nr:hypothetical protein ESA_01204 [Cronobacter sakazakii ATCC BAA-894]